jgi:hypothetical protein
MVNCSGDYPNYSLDLFLLQPPTQLGERVIETLAERGGPDELADPGGRLSCNSPQTSVIYVMRSAWNSVSGYLIGGITGAVAPIAPCSGLRNPEGIAVERRIKAVRVVPSGEI